MRKLLTHPGAKPIIHGVLTLGAFLMWANGGLQWFVPRYFEWALHQTQGLPWFLELPSAACFGALGAVVILGTIKLPVDLLRLVEHLVRRSNARRSST
jgi:hypothetical protein